LLPMPVVGTALLRANATLLAALVTGAKVSEGSRFSVARSGATSASFLSQLSFSPSSPKNARSSEVKRTTNQRFGPTTAAVAAAGSMLSEVGVALALTLLAGGGNASLPAAETAAETGEGSEMSLWRRGKRSPLGGTDGDIKPTPPESSPPLPSLASMLAFVI
jgi:hypothetical protein